MVRSLTNTDNLLKGLTDEQKEVVTHKNGPILIIAGPGSGKTHTITHRIAWLIASGVVSPEDVLAITFTRRAASEMRTRVANLVKCANVPNIYTFHSLGARLIRKYGSSMGLPADVTIFGEADQIGAIKQAAKEVTDLPKNISFRGTKTFISKCKNSSETPEQAAANATGLKEVHYASLYKIYEDILTDAHAVDFDDLLLKSVQLLEGDAEVRTLLQEKFKCILVDEFQDTNKLQLNICLHLTNNERNICAVGDPNQSIYAWRYAEISNILNFQRFFPGAKIAYLSQSFRSTNTILDAANALINNNNKTYEFVKMWSEKEKGDKLFCHEFYSDEDEADFVAREIKKLTLTDKYKNAEIAVMYRTVAQSRAFEKALTSASVPFNLVGGTAYYERAEIKDIMSYLRVILNPRDDAAFQRIINRPRRGIGPRKIAYIQQAAGVNNTSMQAVVDAMLHKPLPMTNSDLLGHKALRNYAEVIGELTELSYKLQPDELINHVIERFEYKDFLAKQDENLLNERMENLQELIGLAKHSRADNPREATTAFLNETMLSTDISDAHGANMSLQDAITLTTIHRVKGLEYDVIFVTGLEEDLLPHIRSLQEGKHGVEEERRLCYVALTRARKLVYMSVAATRNVRYGATASSSRFISEIPAQFISHRKADYNAKNYALPKDNALAGYIIKREKIERNDTKQIMDDDALETIFDVGDVVRHALYGKGVIVSLSASINDTEVVLKFQDGNQRKFMLKHTPLKKIEKPSYMKQSSWQNSYEGYDVVP